LLGLCPYRKATSPNMMYSDLLKSITSYWPISTRLVRNDDGFFIRPDTSTNGKHVGTTVSIS
jgi:hypothetical protein